MRSNESTDKEITDNHILRKTFNHAAFQRTAEQDDNYVSFKHTVYGGDAVEVTNHVKGLADVVTSLFIVMCPLIEYQTSNYRFLVKLEFSRLAFSDDQTVELVW